MKARPIDIDAEELMINALALRSFGHFELALAQSLAAVDASNGREDMVVQAAELMRQCGKADRAAVFLQSWISKSPSSSQWLAELGGILRQLGRDREAIASYEQALQVDPVCPIATTGLVHLLIECGRPREAVNHLMQVAARLDEPLALFLSAASRLACSGYRDAAETVLVKVNQMEPDNVEVKHMTGSIRKDARLAQASPEYVRSLFDRNAPFYDASLQKLCNTGPETIRRVVESWNTDRTASLRILDAGCGTGLCGPCLRPYAARLVGVDLSTEMLRLARGRACYDELILGDLLELESLCGRVFDLIVCSDVLVYFGRLDQVLAVMRRCLRENGSLILTVEKGPEWTNSPDYEIQPTGRYKHTARYLRTALLEAGFRDVPVVRENILRYENQVPVDSLTVVSFS